MRVANESILYDGCVYIFLISVHSSHSFSARFVIYTNQENVNSNFIQRKEAVNYLKKFQIFQSV